MRERERELQEIYRERKRFIESGRRDSKICRERERDRER